MSGLSLDGVSVQIDGNVILNDVSLAVGEGSVTAVLGPSGSGKSTLLRAIAGFVASSGSIELGGVDISKLPTHRRGIGLMFQSHALFPHLNVADNIAFGLVEGGVDRIAAGARVEELLNLVDLDDFGARTIDGLSGGEAQRVALARALAPRPQLLMLDEPLGSLDRRLRDELSDELAQLLRTSGVTSLYVTHDQEEAATVADQLLILEAGEVAAIGGAEELWRRPATPWIARFLGHPNVSDQAVIPVPSIRVGDSGGHEAVVTASRFVDGAWRLELDLAQPVHGLDKLEARSSQEFPLNRPVQLSIDPQAIHRF